MEEAALFPTVLNKTSVPVMASVWRQAPVPVIEAMEE